MHIMVYLIPLLALTVILLIRAELKDQRYYIYILKPLSTLLVIAVVLPVVWQSGSAAPYARYILVGLCLSLGGDLALMFPQNKQAFSLGLGLFLITHIVYTRAFLMLSEWSLGLMLPTLILILLGGVFYRLIQKQLGTMRIPVMLYIIIISIMVASSWTVVSSAGTGLSQAMMIIAGALLFYISDLILAANRFWKPWRYSRISLAFYYAGQLLIALSVWG